MECARRPIGLAKVRRTVGVSAVSMRQQRRHRRACSPCGLKRSNSQLRRTPSRVRARRPRSVGPRRSRRHSVLCASGCAHCEYIYDWVVTPSPETGLNNIRQNISDLRAGGRRPVLRPATAKEGSAAGCPAGRSRPDHPKVAGVERHGECPLTTRTDICTTMCQLMSCNHQHGQCTQ